ncbi:MAG: helix-turn-helix domain-containing protein [Eubacteriales bacterium]|nr:helix-turn-helix domain-containing protein [Eubacteriales bacterium]
MKLSMWMIANRLEALEPELHIRDGAKAVLRSARQAYAQDCVYIYQDGEDSVCAAEEDFLRLKGMEEKQAFEIVQSVFDFYGDWNEEMQAAMLAGDCGLLIDKCWQVFHNPIVLLDANRKVISMSAQYTEDELDEEWGYLSKYGYSSVSSISYLERYYNSVNRRDLSEPRMYRFPPSANRKDCLFAPIFFEGVLYGKIIILEESHQINTGDVELLKYTVKLLGPVLERLTRERKEAAGRSSFLDLVMERPADDKSLDYQMSYLGWNRGDRFRILAFAFREGTYEEELLFLAASQIGSILGQTSVFSSESCIVAVLDENVLSKEAAISMTESIARKNGLYIGESFGAVGIESLPFLYRQAMAALRYGERFQSGQDCYCYYHCAVDSLLDRTGIRRERNADILFACHPDVLRLWKQDQDPGHVGSGRIETLWAYLNNDRSLIGTAQELYVHRSTLVYRIKKLMEELSGDIADAYTRDYIKLSIRMLDLYRIPAEEAPETFV